MGAIITEILAAVVVGGAAVLGYVVYLTSGSESERRNLNRHF